MEADTEHPTAGNPTAPHDESVTVVLERHCRVTVALTHEMYPLKRLDAKTGREVISQNIHLLVHLTEQVTVRYDGTFGIISQPPYTDV